MQLNHAAGELAFDEFPLEVWAIGVGTYVYAVKEVEVTALEEGALCGGADLQRLVHGFLGDHKVAGNDVRNGIVGHNMGYGPHALRDAREGRYLRVTVEFPGKVKEGFPHLELEWRAEGSQVFPLQVPCKFKEIFRGDLPGADAPHLLGVQGGDLRPNPDQMTVVSGN